jgi:hypothetical protein
LEQGDHRIVLPAKAAIFTGQRRKFIKVGFAVQADEGIQSRVYDHFGSAPVFIIVDIEGKEVLTIRIFIMFTVNVIQLWLLTERVWMQWLLEA